MTLFHPHTSIKFIMKNNIVKLIVIIATSISSLTMDANNTKVLAKPAPIQNSEAATFIGSILKAQEKYTNDNKHRGKYAPNLRILKISPESRNYRYKYKITSDGTVVIGIPKKRGLKSYIGTGISWNGGGAENAILISGICSSVKPSQIPPSEPIFRLNTDSPYSSCQEGTIKVCGQNDSPCF
jgi:Type IV pilin-like G and H, putative